MLVEAIEQVNYLKYIISVLLKLFTSSDQSCLTFIERRAMF